MPFGFYTTELVKKRQVEEEYTSVDLNGGRSQDFLTFGTRDTFKTGLYKQERTGVTGGSDPGSQE